MTSCLFSLFKLIYVIFTLMVLVLHASYIYQFVENLQEPKSFFNHNQFAHFMGMFLGFLFRISGLLSACKEKIALTCTYSLFLILILILSRQIDIIFAIHAITAVYAILFVLVLKYRRHKQRKRLLRHQVPPLSSSPASRSSSNNTTTTTSTTNQLAVDLIHGPGSLTNVRPSAPPFETAVQTGGPPPTTIGSMANNNFYSGHINPNYHDQIIANNFVPINHTPPPSYNELFEQTKQ